MRRLLADYLLALSSYELLVLVVLPLNWTRWVSLIKGRMEILRWQVDELSSKSLEWESDES
jgi:hypothetical protein